MFFPNLVIFFLPYGCGKKKKPGVEIEKKNNESVKGDMNCTVF